MAYIYVAGRPPIAFSAWINKHGWNRTAYHALYFVKSGSPKELTPCRQTPRQRSTPRQRRDSIEFDRMFMTVELESPLVSSYYGVVLRIACRKLLMFRAVMLEHGIISHECGEEATSYPPVSPHCLHCPHAMILFSPVEKMLNSCPLSRPHRIFS